MTPTEAGLRLIANKLIEALDTTLDYMETGQCPGCRGGDGMSHEEDCDMRVLIAAAKEIIK